MRRNLAKGLGAGAAFVVLALATALDTSRFADAGSPSATAPQIQSTVGEQWTILPAMNADDQQRAYRPRKPWRHARQHHRRARPEAEASSAPAATTSPVTIESAAAPPQTPLRRSPVEQSPLQLVLTTEDGGDPFEQLMTLYYWSRLNHALPVEQVFAPGQRYAADARVEDTGRSGLLAAFSLYTTQYAAD
jgi:hypothetical protein